MLKKFLFSIPKINLNFFYKSSLQKSTKKNSNKRKELDTDHKLLKIINAGLNKKERIKSLKELQGKPTNVIVFL